MMVDDRNPVDIMRDIILRTNPNAQFIEPEMQALRDYCEQAVSPEQR